MHYALSNRLACGSRNQRVELCEAEAVVPYQYSADLTSNTKLAGQSACRESNPTRIMHDDVRHVMRHTRTHVYV